MRSPLLKDTATVIPNTLLPCGNVGLTDQMFWFFNQSWKFGFWHEISQCLKNSWHHPKISIYSVHKMKDIFRLNPFMDHPLMIYIMGLAGRNTPREKTNNNFISVHFSSVQSLSCVRLSATPWTAARQASLSITNSQSLHKLMSIESVMPSNHLILCHPLLLTSEYLMLVWALCRNTATTKIKQMGLDFQNLRI